MRSAPTAGSCEVDTQSDPTQAAGRNHVPSSSYTVDPPAGGDHLAPAARSGVYEGTSVPADGLLVHSLEHGYAIVWHQPDLPDDERTRLEELERGNDDDVIIAERASLPVPVAATALGHRLLCQEVEPAVLERSIDERVGVRRTASAASGSSPARAWRRHSTGRTRYGQLAGEPGRPMVEAGPRPERVVSVASRVTAGPACRRTKSPR